MQNGHLINILALKSTLTYWYLTSNLVSNTQCSGSPQICRLPSFPCYPLISLNVSKSKQALHYFQRAERPASWSCHQNQTGSGGGEALGLVTKFVLVPFLTPIHQCYYQVAALLSFKEASFSLCQGLICPVW